ncbi:MAG: prepilin-type N-terminal cleavage/methylation domain-containing protein [Candidatus Binatia bacterium]|jgi:type IV pilus assembly protein PilA
MRTIGNKGFTLIELLVVVTIIGILAGIAIEQFAAYRQKGYDAQAISDLRNAAKAEEAYFATQLQFIVCTSAAACAAALPGLNVSLNTSMAMGIVGTTDFMGTATSSKGTGITCHWDSSSGGFLGCS